MTRQASEAHEPPLERRYRRLLQVLPDWYREAHEEALVGSFLEKAWTGDPERDEHRSTFGRPAVKDWAEVVGLGTRLRLGGATSPPRSRVVGDGLRRYALLIVLTLAVSGTMDIAQALWTRGLLPFPQRAGSAVLTSPLGGPSSIIAPLIGLAWLVSFLALALSRSRVARITALAAFSLLCYGTFSRIGGIAPAAWLGAAATLLVGASALLAMAAFHSDAPRMRGTGWLIGFLATLAAIVGAQLWVTHAGGSVPLWVDLQGAYVLVAVVIGLAHVAQPWVTARPRTPAWSLALACFAGAAAVARALTAAAYAAAGDFGPQHVTATIRWQAVIAVAMAVLLAVIARSALRRHEGPAAT